MAYILDKMRGITVQTQAGTEMFFPAAGPIPGDKVVLYPVSKSTNVTLSVDTSPELAIGDNVALINIKTGWIVYKPEYPTLPAPPVNNIVLLQKLTNGFGPVTVGHGVYEIIGHYTVFWDGLGELWISGAPDAITAFSVDDTLRLYKCYGYIDYPGSGVLAGPLNVTSDTVASGAIFFKPNWMNLFKCYVINNQGTTDGSSELYLINVRPLP